MRLAQAETQHERQGDPQGRGIGALVLGVVIALGLVPVLAMMQSPRSTAPAAAVQAPAAAVQAPAAPFAVAARQILFEDKPDGTAEIVDAVDRTVLASMSTKDGGFVRSTLRLLQVERRRWRADTDAPFVVTRWSNGSVNVLDPATSKTIEVNAFGITNASAFVQLLETRSTAP